MWGNKSVIVVNQTFSLESQHVAEWQAWLKSHYLPHVLASGLFVDHMLLRLWQLEPDALPSYALQLVSPEHTFDTDAAEAILNKMEEELYVRFVDKVMVFRTILQKVEY